MALTPDPLSAAAAQQIATVLNQTLESPLKEVGNYIADKVRYLRYKSLLKIVKAAKSRAAEEGLALQMPPLKFFVPFCEGASLEEDADEDEVHLSDLQEMWKRLLVSASAEYDSRHQVFTRILREITGNEVAYLRRMLDEARATTRFRASSAHFVDAPFYSPDIVGILCAEAASLGDEELGRIVIDCLECPGVLFYAVLLGQGEPFEADGSVYIFESDWYHSDERNASHALLESLGLIRYFRLAYKYFDEGRYVDVEGVQLTQLGAGFIEKCTDLGRNFKFSRRMEIGEDGTVTYEPL